MKTVAVSQRIDAFPDRNETRDALDQRMMFFIQACGFMPFPVPNTLKGSVCQWLDTLQPAAIVLSGGNDIGHCAERDFTDLSLLKYAWERRLPLLGICRGMQMIGHWAGVELEKVNGHVNTRHLIIGSISKEVNSFHNFSLATCPKNFSVLARSEDEKIEAIRNLSSPWEGWMWHPEREKKFSDVDIQRVRALFQV